MSTEPSQNALLNLASLLNQDASIYEIEGEGQLLADASKLAKGTRLQDSIHWRIVVRSTGGDDDFILEGDVSGSALMECRRCLDDVTVSAEASFVYPMIYKQGTEGLVLTEDKEAEDDLLVFGQPEVDFADLITQLFAIELPLTALCKEDCKGLSTDGVNLNHHPNHEVAVEAEKTSPFAALKDIEL